MSEKEILKVTDEELNKVRELRNNYQQIMLQLGQAELQLNDLKVAMKEIDGAKAQLLAKYEDIKKNERSSLDELNKKYGVGTLNVENGMFTPNQ